MASMYDMLFADAATRAIRYDADETNPVPVSLVVSSYQAVKTRGEARKSTQGQLAPGTAMTPGQLLQQGTRWYLVSDVLDESPVLLAQVNVRTLLLPLPYVVTGTRYTIVSGTRTQQQAAVNWNNEPYADPVTGLPTAALTPITVRAALSVDFNPLLELPEGQEPGGITSMYVPLGADVRLDDRFTLPSGHIAIVQQINDLMASGARWARQLIFNQEG